MTNADKFKNIFGLYATELWSMPEKDFLRWLNSEAMNCSEFPNNSDAIYRQDAIELVKDVCDAIMSGCESWYDPETKDEVYKDIREVNAILKCNKEVRIALRNMLSAQPEIIRCKDCKHYYYADNRIPQEQRYSCDLDGDRWKPEDFCSYAERRTDG